jgi:hypothetical protein
LLTKSIASRQTSIESFLHIPSPADTEAGRMLCPNRHTSSNTLDNDYRIIAHLISSDFLSQAFS